MIELQMGANESKFADIIWEHEPITAAELAKYGDSVMHWKKTTSYTVLKRLCDKGIFHNDKGMVTACVSRQEFYAMQSEKFVEDTFDGSLPAFLAAFAGRKKYTDEEVDKMKQILDSMRR